MTVPVAWPTGVRLAQLVGIRRQRQDAVIRTAMDSGPGKARRRFSAASTFVRVPVQWPGAEYKLFEAWFDADLALGARTFTWDDPINGTQVTMRFRTVPEFALELPGDTDEQWWSAMLDLEILP